MDKNSEITLKSILKCVHFFSSSLSLSPLRPPVSLTWMTTTAPSNPLYSTAKVLFLKDKYHPVSPITGLPQWLSGKEFACNAGDAGDVGLNPGSGGSPGRCMAIHSSILAWRIPWTEEPGRLYSP